MNKQLWFLMIHGETRRHAMLGSYYKPDCTTTWIIKMFVSQGERDRADSSLFKIYKNTKIISYSPPYLCPHFVSLCSFICTHVALTDWFLHKYIYCLLFLTTAGKNTELWSLTPTQTMMSHQGLVWEDMSSWQRALLLHQRYCCSVIFSVSGCFHKRTTLSDATPVKTWSVKWS